MPMDPTRYAFEDDSHAAVREQATRFASTEIAPYGAGWEEAGGFPVELYAAAGRVGLTGIGYPEALGGQGGDLGHVLVAADALIRVGRTVGTAVGLGSHHIACPPIVRHGTDAQRARFVTPVLAGAQIAALAITEPGGGSDVAGLTTTARRDGDHYVVDGCKTFITSGTRADWVLTAVRTGGSGHAGVSLLIIERTTPGFASSAPLRKTGWWASDTAELTFDGCRVPVENRVGPEHAAFAMIAANFAGERLMLAAQCVSIAELAYRESIAWTQQRRAFGKPLTGFQVTRHRLADMATKVEAAHQMMVKAARLKDSGQRNDLEAGMAKYLAAEYCADVVGQSFRIHGGYGYSKEYEIERLYREAPMLLIGEGTAEIQKMIIGRRLLEDYKLKG